MATNRKWFNMILPEVRKPSGYGTLVQVLQTNESIRELWFQHAEDPTILRCVKVDVASGEAERPKTILTKGVRASKE
ncbi:hypothetical protein GCM10027564_22270 [Luteimonas notoginsengisoli]